MIMSHLLLVVAIPAPFANHTALALSPPSGGAAADPEIFRQLPPEEVVMSRRVFPPVALPAAAGLVALLLVAAAAGGVRGGVSAGNAALPRKLAAGGSGNSAAAAELVKDSPRASAEGDGLVVKDSAPSASGGEAEAEAQIPPLQLILAEEGRAEGAVCLDGLAPGFYYRKGYGSGQNNWVLYYEV
ncbi:unnamed protein product [Closterium sp. NIES-53]